MADEAPVVAAPAAGETTTNPEPAAAAKIEAKSFVDFFDKAYVNLDVKEDKPADPNPAAVKTDDPPVIPPAAAVTPAEAETPEDQEKKLDELFASNAGQAFKNIKGQVKELRTQLEAEKTRYTAELEAAKKGVVPSTEAETLKAQLAERDKVMQEYETELALTRVEGTRAYKEHVAKPLAALRSGVDAIAAASTGGFKTTDIMAALTEADPAKKDAALSEIAASIPERHRFNLYKIDEQYAGLAAQEKFVRDNAVEALKLVQERENAGNKARTEAFQKEYTTALDSTWSELQKQVPFLRPVEGQEKWNATLGDLDKLARSTNFETLAPTDRATLAYQAQAFPLAVNALNYYASEVVRLEKALKAREAGTPGAGGGTNPNPAPDGTKKPVSEGGFMEAMMK